MPRHRLRNVVLSRSNNSFPQSLEWAIMRIALFKKSDLLGLTGTLVEHVRKMGYLCGLCSGLLEKLKSKVSRSGLIELETQM